MDAQFPEKRTAYLDSLRTALKKDFSDLWQEHCSPFPDNGDYLKILNAGSFSLQIAGIQFWIDLKVPPFAEPLSKKALSHMFTSDGLYLLTHHHADHFDPDILNAAADAGRKIVTHSNRACELEEAGIAPAAIQTVEPGDVFTMGSLSIEVTATPHINISDSVAYTISGCRKKVLILSDIREYKTSFAQQVPQHDIMIFNVWLGRKIALEYSKWQLQEAAAFIQAAAPGKVYFAHLYDLSRPPGDTWTYMHAAALREALEILNTEIETIVPARNRLYRIDQ